MTGRIFQKRAFKIFIFLIVLTLGGFLFYKQTTMPKIPENFESQKFTTTKNEVLIGVISDTHIPERADSLPKEVFKIFQNVDLILHSGDIVNLQTLERLKKIAPTIAVEGNMDFPEVKEKLPKVIGLEVFSFRIAILHSPIPTWTLSHFNWLQEMAVKKLAKEQNFDILIFGHTHRPLLKELDVSGKGFLLLNPGSPTFPFFFEPSVAILKITKDSFKAEIIHLEKRIK